MRPLLRLCGWLLLSLLVPGAVSAAPCLSGSFADYVALGASGCELGPVSVAQFSVEPGQSFASPIDPATVQVTPGGSASVGTLTLTFAASAAAGELLELFFRMNVTAPVLVAAGIAIASGSASGDGVVTATQDLCPDGLFSGNAPIGCSSTPETLIAFASESDALLSADVGLAGATFLDVFTDIAIDGGLAGAAGLGTVMLTFVPEPDTGALVAVGLALVSLYRARRRP
jgi:hypothetical protein